MKLKVCVGGVKRVGKSSLVARFTRDPFDTKTHWTFGVSFARKYMKSSLKKLHDFLQNTIGNIKLDLEQLEKIHPPPQPPAEGMKEGFKVCGSCGQETLSPETTPAKFCSHCGTPL